MKRYKLIREYPGSPKLGFESLSKEINGEDCVYIKGGYIEPNQYPEFWEEVIEKDFEILYIKGLSTEPLLEGKASIYKIKRLSDGEIFTVGDIIENNIIINEFAITPYNNINIWCNYVNTKEKRECLDDFLILLKHCKHPKKPLLKTEDGVHIFEGHIYYTVNSKNNFKIDKGFINRNFEKNIFNYKYFSTKEKAEQYILMNKPCLSLNEVFNIYPQCKRSSNSINTKHANDLIYLAKNKMK